MSQHTWQHLCESISKESRSGEWSMLDVGHPPFGGAAPRTGSPLSRGTQQEAEGREVPVPLVPRGSRAALPGLSPGAGLA